MNFDNITNQIYVIAYNEAKLRGHEFLTPEHILYSSILFDSGKIILENSGADIEAINENLSDFFDNTLEHFDNIEPFESFGTLELIDNAEKNRINTNKSKITLTDIFVSFFALTDSFAKYALETGGLTKVSLLKYISHDMPKKPNLKLNTAINTRTEKEDEFLNKYTTELTELASDGKLDPLIGRDDVLERTIQVLSRRLKNNPIHVGEPGVGKTSVAEGIAQKIAAGDVPEIIKNSKMYYLDVASVIAGTKYRGDFEERLLKILELVSKDKNPIIYIDEIHNIVGAGAVSGGAMDATGILKPYLLKSNIKFVGSTTYSEYKKYFEKDNALTRRFQKIDINEPTIDDCIQILKGIKNKYETFHNVKYTDAAIESACKLSYKYIRNRQLPDKAIDVIDEAGAYVRIKSKSNNKITIKDSDIKKVVSKMAGVPSEKLTSNNITKLKNLEINLKKKIFGQDIAIEKICDIIKESYSGLKDAEKPSASFLFVGPTGVGKTEIARQLSENLDIPLIRFDMSEYQEKHSVAKLIGSPPGYIGYDDGGLLTEAVSKSPHSVVLLDEIEKSHQDIRNILLQVMDYGTLTDSTGKKIDFRNIILILTTNTGAVNADKRAIGFEEKNIFEEAFEKGVENTFSPEFRNRLDEIITFNRISNETAVLIAKKYISTLSANLKKQNIKIKVSEKIFSYIAEKGLTEKYGAREISRIIEKDIKKPLVNEILFGKLANGGIINLTLKNNSIEITHK